MEKRKTFSFRDLNKIAKDIDQYNELTIEEKKEKNSEILEIFSKILILRENSDLLYYSYYDDNDHNKYYYGDELKYIPKELQINFVEDVLYFLDKTGYDSFEYLDDRIKLQNLEICKKAYAKHEKNLNYIPQKIIDRYPEFFAFEKISDEEKIKNVSLCERAIKLKPKNLKFVPFEIMKQNIEMCVVALKMSQVCIEYIPKEILINYPSLCFEVIKHKSYYIKYIPDEILKNNLELYELSEWNFCELSDSLKRNIDFLILAAEKDYTSIKGIVEWFECECLVFQKK